MAASLAERLDYLSEPRVEGRCQLWLGAKSAGYGRVRWRGRSIQAHRATWMCEVGPIPEGLHVLHRCDVRACRNIDHLFLGTNLDNVRDRDTKARQARQPGEANGRAKLTEADVLEIRAIPLDVPHWVVAAMYGVVRTTVGQIRRGGLWAHVA